MSDDALAQDTSNAASTSTTPKASINRWEGPEFNSGVDHTSVAPGISISQLEALQQQAYEESYALGLQEGRTAGEATAHAEAQRFGQLLTQLSRPFDQLDDTVEQQVVHLALMIARSVIRRELKTDPSHVIGAVREALGALPIAARDVCVRLHPEDAALVRKHLNPTQGEVAWTIQEDPVLTRGGCRVDAGHSHIDARVESRMASLVAAVLNDERASEDGSRQQNNESTHGVASSSQSPDSNQASDD